MRTAKWSRAASCSMQFGYGLHPFTLLINAVEAAPSSSPPSLHRGLVPTRCMDQGGDDEHVRPDCNTVCTVIIILASATVTVHTAAMLRDAKPTLALTTIVCVSICDMFAESVERASHQVVACQAELMIVHRDSDQCQCHCSSVSVALFRTHQ